VCRRIGDHKAGKPVPVLHGLLPQILNIDISPFVAVHNNNLHSCHHRAGRVCAVRRGWNKGDIPVTLSPGLVIFPDYQQARVFTSSPRIRLERHCREPGYLFEGIAKLIHHLIVAFSLIGRNKGMNISEFGPAHGEHRGSGIQLHGAGPQ